MRYLLLVVVAAAVTTVQCKLLPPPQLRSMYTTTKSTTSAAPTTQEATPMTTPPPPPPPTTTTTTQSTAAPPEPATADDAPQLSECASPALSMSLRSARNSTGLWTDKVYLADAAEQGGERVPAGYRLEVSHSASYSCGGVESSALTVTLTAPVLPLPAAGKL